MAKAIGTLGSVDTITVGDRSFTDLTNIIILHGITATTNGRCTLRKATGSAGYPVTAAKTLHVYAIRVTSTAASEIKGVMAQTDNDVGMSSATAFTNPVYFAGALTVDMGSSLANIGASYTLACDFTVAAGKFLSYDDNNSGQAAIIVAYCYEV